MSQRPTALLRGHRLPAVNDGEVANDVVAMANGAEALRFERRLYYAAKLTSQVAQNVLLAALFVIAGTSSHAAIGLSSLFVATLIPAVLFGVLGGALGDRLGASRGFMFGSMLRFLTVFAAFAFASGPNTAWVVAF